MAADNLSALISGMQGEMAALRRKLTDTQAELAALKSFQENSPLPAPADSFNTGTRVGRRRLLKRFGKGVAAGVAAAAMSFLPVSAGRGFFQPGPPPSPG